MKSKPAVAVPTKSESWCSVFMAWPKSTKTGRKPKVAAENGGGLYTWGDVRSVVVEEGR
ncbi:MAG: hypothetical protein KC912_21800 [Proteobacteria bacterium]|nr:hypothetical protein [Pseudomonadota bacterium]